MKTPKELMQGLYDQALQNEHCDVTFEIHGKEYGAHRGVLVQASPYFESMFRGHFCETQSGSVSLTDVVPNTHLFEAILEYMYLGVFVLSAHDIEETLGVASLMLLDNVVRACQQLLLEQLTLNNVLHTWAVAELYSLHQLGAVCRELVRCRFHDTLIHQPEVRTLPLNLLCHFIKEGMFRFLQLQTKMVVLQQWLKENTTVQPDNGKLLCSKIAKEVEAVEPDLSRALFKVDFLNQGTHMKTKEEMVSCFVKLLPCPSQTLNLHIHDLYRGQLYESSQKVPDKFSLFLGTTGRFIILQSSDKQELCALDEKHQRTIELVSPVHVNASDHHFFSLGKNIMCLVVSDDSDTQDKQVNVNTKVSAERRQAPLTFWLNYVEAIDETISNQPQTILTPECKQHRIHLFQLEPGCWLEGEATHTESIITTVKPSDDPSPGTSSGLKSSSHKHSHPSPCLTCPLTWKFISHIKQPEIDFHNNSVVDFQSVESGHRVWVMLRLVNVGNSAGTTRTHSTLSALCFCLQEVQEDNGPSTLIKVEYLPSPCKSRHHSLDEIKRWGRLQKCPGSVQLYIQGFCKYFDPDEWKWVSKRGGNAKSWGICDIIMGPDPPDTVSLPIFPKQGQIVPKTTSSSWANFISVCNTYSNITYLWRHLEEENRWEELPSLCWSPDGYMYWTHAEVGRCALDTLQAVPQTGGNGHLWDRDTPFAGFQFESD